MPKRVRPAGAPVMFPVRLASGRAACLAAAGLGVWFTSMQEAQAQGLLPPVGADVRVGDLRQQFTRVFDENPPQNATQTWTYTPSIGISETFDNGVRRLNQTFGADEVTRITPELNVTGQSSRLQGTFDYAPTASVYAHNGNLNGVQQSLNTSGTATLVPDLLFLELRGYSATQSYYTGQYALNPSQLAPQQQVQSSSFTATPTLRHEFGSYGQVAASYSISRTLIDASKVVALRGEPAPPSNFGNSTTQQENASFTTGDEFGRIKSVLSAATLQTIGGGASINQRSAVFNDQMSYAFTRLVALTASLGHEDIVYTGATKYKINDITWSGGIQLTPNADSNISIGYGRSQGGTSLSLDSTYAPTERTRVYARYSQGVGTQAGNLRDAVANSVVGAGGITLDAAGAPVQLNTGTIGYQPGLYRTTRLSLSGVILFELDTVTLSFEHDDSNVINTTNAGTSVGTSSTGTTSSLAWSHIFTDALNANSTLQYGTTSFGAGGPGNQQTTISTSVTLAYAISQTLNATSSGTYTHVSGITFGYPVNHEIFVAGLRKTF